jgi:hypothetical protein
MMFVCHQKNVFFCSVFDSEMGFRMFFLWFLFFLYADAQAETVVELNVAFRDSTVRCGGVCVLAAGVAGDTLVVFDSLSFRGMEEVSLFYDIVANGVHRLLVYDTDGAEMESNTFRVSHRRTAFSVLIGKGSVRVSGMPYLFPRRVGARYPFLSFLLVSFLFKIVFSTVFVLISGVLTSGQRFRLVWVAGVAFLLSAPIGWLLPAPHLLRLLIIMAVDWGVIVLLCRGYVGRRMAMRMVMVVGVPVYGLIAVSHLLVWVFF